MRWILLFLLLPLVWSANINISNSADWRFAYILGYYSFVGGDYFYGLDSQATAREVFPYLPSEREKQTDTVTIFSDRNPIMDNYDTFLRGMGFRNVRTEVYRDFDELTQTLFQRYGPFECYVIVADGGGEWAYAGSALAARYKCALFIANTDTIDTITSLVPKDGNIIIIGYAGKRLKETFPNAIIINTGNRAKDTVEVARIHSKKPATVYLVSGMYLYLPGHYKDPAVWTGGGSIPILAAYPDELPEPVKDYILKSGVKFVGFYGAELYDLYGREREELSKEGVKALVFTTLKFRNVPTRDPNKEYPPNVLFMPGGDVFVSLERVNALAEGKILFRFRNTGKGIVYLMPLIVNVKCGGEEVPISLPEEPLVILPESVYIWEVSTQPLPSTGCEVYFEGRYGPDKDRMMFDYNTTLGFMPEKIEDPSTLEVKRVLYSPRLKAFVIYVSNPSSVKVYAYPSLKGVLVDGIPTDFSGRMGVVPPNGEGKLYVKAELSDADIIDNPTVKVMIRYGKRADLPIKLLEGEFNLEKETFTDVVVELIQENFVLVTAIVVLILVILLILRRR